MKVWDWEQAAKQNDKYEVAYLRATHNEAISEEQFVAGWMALPFSEKQIHRTKHRGPAKARNQYRRLKANFGFFGGAAA